MDVARWFRRVGKRGGGVGDVFVFEVAFLEDPSETQIQNHSHEIRLEKLVCCLLYISDAAHE